jgi:hypothetical protein
MLLQSQIGKQSNANGATPNIRGLREGDLAVSQNHGDYYTKNAEGDAFSVSTLLAGITLAASHTIATLTAAATPVISIFNGGTKNISINREYVGTLSGTPAPGNWWWYAATGQQGTALTTLTDLGVNSKTYGTSSDLGEGVKLGLGKALTGLTGPLIQYKPCGSLNTVTAGLGVIDRETQGSIIVPPGILLALLAPAIGTTHVVHASIDLTRVEVTS